MRRISGREHALLIAALAAAALFGADLLRLRPVRARTESLRRQAGHFARRRENSVWPRPAPGDAGDAARRDSLRKEAEAARAAVAELESRFVSRRAPALADELRLSISAIADRCGVLVRENLPCNEAALRAYAGDRRTAAADFVRFFTLGEPYALAAREVAVETDFAGLRRFLAGLDRLDGRVLVLRFDVAAIEGAPRLRARLVLVF